MFVMDDKEKLPMKSQLVPPIVQTIRATALKPAPMLPVVRCFVVLPKLLCLLGTKKVQIDPQCILSAVCRRWNRITFQIIVMSDHVTGTAVT